MEKSNEFALLSCAVCGTRCFRFSYGVPSCQGCQHFFRRVFLNQKFYQCTDPVKCEIVKTKGCRGCRLDKCLRAGMNWKCIRPDPFAMTSEFGIVLEQRRKRLLEMAEDRWMAKGKLNVVPQQVCVRDDLFEANRLLALLSRAGQSALVLFAKAKCLRQHSLLPPQFNSLSELLAWKGNIVELVCSITVDMPFVSLQTVLEQMCKGTHFSYRPTPILTDMAAIIHFVKTLPFFQKLDLDDQVCLVNYVGIPLLDLCLKYASACLNSDIVIVNPCNGFSPLFLYQSELYRNNNTVQSLSNYAFHSSMEPYNRTRLTETEFLMLKVIVAAHSATSGLSAQGRELVHSEMERYAGMLMRLLQQRLGGLGGAKRYAQILHFAECAFHAGEKIRNLCAYVAMVTDQGTFHARVPPTFHKMCILGSE